MDDKKKTLDVDYAIRHFETAEIWDSEDAEAMREYGEKFARAVAALVMDLDALELPQVAALMAEHGVRV